MPRLTKFVTGGGEVPRGFAVFHIRTPRSAIVIHFECTLTLHRFLVRNDIGKYEAVDICTYQLMVFLSVELNTQDIHNKRQNTGSFAVRASKPAVIFVMGMIRCASFNTELISHKYNLIKRLIITFFL